MAKSSNSNGRGKVINNLKTMKKGPYGTMGYNHQRPRKQYGKGKLDYHPFSGEVKH